MTTTTERKRALPTPPPGGPDPPEVLQSDSEPDEIKETPFDSAPDSLPAVPVASALAPIKNQIAKPRSAPKPKHFKYSSASGKGMQPNDFFAYWESLPADIKSQCKAYVYMNWPVIARPAPTKKNPKGTTHQIDMLPGEDVIRDEDDFLHRYSSGDFMIRLNEQVVKRGTIAMCTLRLRDTEQPPRVPDLNWLVREDPANASYINQLRLDSARLPWEGPAPEEEDEMAVNTAVTEQLTQTVERLTDKVISQAERRNEAPPQQTDPVAGKLASMNLDTIRESVTMGNGIIKDAMAQATAIAGKQADPIAMIAPLVALLKDLSPKPDSGSSDMIRLMMEQQAAHHKEMTTLLMEQVRQSREDAAAAKLQAHPAGAPGAAPGSLIEQVKSLGELWDVMSNLRGKGADAEDAAEALAGGGGKASALLQLVPLAGGLLNGIIGGVANAVYNYAVAARGIGEPAPPPAAAANPELGPGTAPAEAPKQNPAEIVLNQIRQPLTEALNQGKTGYEFAEDLISFTSSRGLYDQLHEVGKENLFILIQRFDAQLWAFLTSISSRANVFFDEFLGYDAWLATQPQEDEDENEPDEAEPIEAQEIPAEAVTSVSVATAPVAGPQPVQRPKRG